jgi:hypothetical protein
MMSDPGFLYLLLLPDHVFQQRRFRMKKVWKWIIGIVVVLVVVAAVVGSVFLLRSHFANVVSLGTYRTAPVPRTGKLPFDNNGNGQRGGPGGFPGMMPYGWGGQGLRMGGPGMMGFGGRMFFGGLFGCLLSLGLLALLVLGIIWLVRRVGKPSPVTASVEPAMAPVAPAVAVHPCSKCGQPVQEGWKHCPNCGKRQ